MAKITGLPTTDKLTGAEHLPIVQGNTTKRVTMDAFRSLITPFLQNWYKGDRGDVGEAANTFDSMARMRDLDPVRYPSAVLADGVQPPISYAFIRGNYTGRVDDVTIVALNRVPAAEGALVRQDLDGLTFRARFAGAIARLGGAKSEERVSVKDFGAVGDGVTDDTAALNRALNSDRRRLVVPPGAYKISDRLLMTKPGTSLLLDGARIFGNPWRYPGGQLPFGSLFVITANGCGIEGARGSGATIEVMGGSEANGITFLHCDGGYVGHLLLLGNCATTTGIHDDTFGTGIAIFNTADSNPSKKTSRFTFDHVVAREWMHYGGQVWGELVELSVLDSDFCDNGRGDDAVSVGCGFAVTYGVRNLLMSRVRLNRNKRHGVLQSSAGLRSDILRFSDFEAIGNGAWGLSFTEEGNVWSRPGVGTNGIFTKGGTIKNNGGRGSGGGVRVGTYDGAGFILNVQLDDDVLDNTGYGVLVQTNAEVDHRVVRVEINSAIIGNTVGLGLGATLDDTVKWNACKIAGNGEDIANAGDSRLVSNARGYGGVLQAAANMSVPRHGDSFTLARGEAQIDNIVPSQGRMVTFIFGGAIKVSNTGNIVMATPFEGTGNCTLTLLSSATAWFEVSRSKNS